MINLFLSLEVVREDRFQFFFFLKVAEKRRKSIHEKKRKQKPTDIQALAFFLDLVCKHKRQSEDWKRAEVITHYEKIIKDLKAGEKASSQDIDKQEIKESIALYKQEMMEELAAIDEGTDPLTVARKKFDEAKTFAEKNKLRMRIERLQGNAGREQKSSEDAVKKALAYREDEERESRDTNDAYLMLATAENIADDARIKAAKAEIAKYIKEYKQMMADGRTERANSYRKRNQKYFTANDIIQQQSRSMTTNKKLLGKGHDSAIMKLIDQNRKQMLKVIDGLE